MTMSKMWYGCKGGGSNKKSPTANTTKWKTCFDYRYGKFGIMRGFPFNSIHNCIHEKKTGMFHLSSCQAQKYILKTVKQQLDLKLPTVL